MPCVLPVEEKACCNPEAETQALPAMVVEFPQGGPMLGSYCGLVCYLMNSGKWQLAKKRSGAPVHVTRSSVHMKVPGFPGKVTLNDPLSTFFTLTFHGRSDVASSVCPLIRETILTGIEEVAKNLNYLPRGKDEATPIHTVQNQPQITFLCSCEATPLHPAIMSECGNLLGCPYNDLVCDDVTAEHRVWLQCESLPIYCH